MGHSCGIGMHLGYKHFSIYSHDHEKVTNSSIFQIKKLNSNYTNKNYKRPLLCNNALDNNNAADNLVAAPVPPHKISTMVPQTLAQQTAFKDGSTSMSVVLAPGLEPATIVIPTHVKRSDFPPGFVFGASTSAFQVSRSIFFRSFTIKIKIKCT